MFQPHFTKGFMNCRRQLFGLGLTLVLGVPLSAQTLKYPETKKVDVVEDYRGTRVPDPFRLLEDQNVVETAIWVKAQNDVTFPYRTALPEREKVRRPLTELWDYPRYGTPFTEGG